jgi:antimicrobial peptide system SdpA family protein
MSTGSAAQPHRTDDLRLGRWVATAGVLALVLAVYVVHAALPATPFRLPFDNPRATKTVVPEGWAFFTISPRTPDPIVYAAQPGGGWLDLTTGSHASPDTAFSLNRLNRSQGTEIAIVANQVPPTEWTTCDQAPTSCLSTLFATRTVVNTSTHRSICGDVGLTIQRLVPWAWRGLPTVMPSKIVRVMVTC